jgi:hypothetical protein
LLLEHLCPEYPTIIPFSFPSLSLSLSFPLSPLAKRHSFASHSDISDSPSFSSGAVLRPRDRRRRLSIVSVPPRRAVTGRRTPIRYILQLSRRAQRRSFRLRRASFRASASRFRPSSALCRLGSLSPFSLFASPFLSTLLVLVFHRFVAPPAVVGLSRESRNFISL